MKRENEKIKELEEKIRALEEDKKVLIHKKTVLQHKILRMKHEHGIFMTSTEKQILQNRGWRARHDGLTEEDIAVGRDVRECYYLDL